MKTAIQQVMDEIEMEHNNGVEISQRALWKMLLEAKEKEKQQIIDAGNGGALIWIAKTNKLGQSTGEQYYNETFKNN